MKKLVPVASLLFLLAACGGSDGPSEAAGTPPSADKAPVQIAFVAELSGAPAFVTIGRATEAGAKTAVARINAAGGIDGHPIELKEYDTRSDPTAGGAVLRDVVAAKPAVITGFNVSATLSPSASVIAAAKIPWLTSGAIFSGVDTLPFFFSSGPSNQNSGRLMVKAVESLLGGSVKGKRVALLATTPSIPGDEKINAAKAALEAAGATAGPVIRDPNNFSAWSSQAANVVASHADAVISFHSEVGAPTVAKALDIAGFAGPIVQDITANSDTAFKAIGSANFYAIRDFKTPAPGSPLYQAIEQAGASTERALGSASLFARQYAGMYAIAQTLEKCGLPCTADAFSSTLRSLGPIKVPDDPFFAPLDFSKSNAGENFGQVWGWDPATSTVVAHGKVMKVKA